MPKGRKTFSIAGVLYEINQKNQSSTCDPQVRQGWNSMLESILMAADVYSGFGYLDFADVPQGQSPGIRFVSSHGNDLTPVEYYDRLASDHQRDRQAFHKVFDGDVKSYPDETRRLYYVHHVLSDPYRKLSGHASPYLDPRERALPVPTAASVVLRDELNARQDVADLCNELEATK